LSPRAIKDLADTFGGAEVQRLLGTKTAPQIQALRQGLLAATANPAQLARLQGFAKGDALLIDRLLKDIGSAADLEHFLTLLGGDAAGFEKAMRFFGGAIEIRKIMVEATTVAIDPTSLGRLFRMAQANGWSKADNIVRFLTKVHGASPRPSWQDALDWTEDFHIHHQGTITLGSGSDTVLASPSSFVDLSLTSGVRRIIITQYDLNHFLTGHTFEQFVFNSSNIGRNAFSTMWPAGTSDATILATARQVMQDPALATKIQGAMTSSNGFVADIVSIGGDRYVVGVQVSTGRLTQFYKDNGVRIPKGALQAIRDILGK